MLKSPGKDQEKLNLKIDRQIKKKRILKKEKKKNRERARN